MREKHQVIYELPLDELADEDGNLTQDIQRNLPNAVYWYTSSFVYLQF